MEEMPMSKPTPDPTRLTTGQLVREINAVKSLLDDAQEARSREQKATTPTVIAAARRVRGVHRRLAGKAALGRGRQVPHCCRRLLHVGRTSV